MQTIKCFRLEAFFEPTNALVARFSTRKAAEDAKPSAGGCGTIILEETITVYETRTKPEVTMLQKGELRVAMEKSRLKADPSKEPSKHEGLYRDGDVILFASESQQEAFEKSLLVEIGCEKMVELLAKQIARTGIATTRWWDAVREFKQPGERVFYDWITRQIRLSRS